MNLSRLFEVFSVPMATRGIRWNPPCRRPCEWRNGLITESFRHISILFAPQCERFALSLTPTKQRHASARGKIDDTSTAHSPSSRLSHQASAKRRLLSERHPAGIPGAVCGSTLRQTESEAAQVTRRTLPSVPIGTPTLGSIPVAQQAVPTPHASHSMEICQRRRWESSSAIWECVSKLTKWCALPEPVVDVP